MSTETREPTITVGPDLPNRPALERVAEVALGAHKELAEHGFTDHGETDGIAVNAPGIDIHVRDDNPTLIVTMDEANFAKSGNATGRLFKGEAQGQYTATGRRVSVSREISERDMTTRAKRTDGPKRAPTYGEVEDGHTYKHSFGLDTGVRAGEILADRAIKDIEASVEDVKKS